MKLYWRTKNKDGKRTWIAACMNFIHVDGHVIDCTCYEQEEE